MAHFEVNRLFYSRFIKYFLNKNSIYNNITLIILNFYSRKGVKMEKELVSKFLKSCEGSKEDKLSTHGILLSPGDLETINQFFERYGYLKKGRFFRAAIMLCIKDIFDFELVSTVSQESIEPKAKELKTMDTPAYTGTRQNTSVTVDGKTYIPSYDEDGMDQYGTYKFEVDGALEIQGIVKKQ
jgi:hypothetical protein